MLQACLQLHPLDRPLRVGIHKRLLVTGRLGTHPGVLCIVAAPELYVMLYNYMLS